jgi:hypothetical protein
MYSNQFSLPDSDDEEEENKELRDKINETKKENYSKLDEIKEMDNKLELEDEKKDEKKDGIDKDKTQDISSRSIDHLVKNDEEKKEAMKIELANAPTAVAQKKKLKKPKKFMAKGLGFDTVRLIIM